MDGESDLFQFINKASLNYDQYQGADEMKDQKNSQPNDVNKKEQTQDKKTKNLQKKQSIVRAYKQRPKKELWIAYLEVILERRLVFISWRNQFKLDLFVQIAKKVPKISRDDIKSWDQTQRLKYLPQNLDIFEAILHELSIMQVNKELSEKQIIYLREFQELNEERKILKDKIELDIDQSNISLKQLRNLNKKIKIHQNQSKIIVKKQIHQ